MVVVVDAVDVDYKYIIYDCILIDATMLVSCHTVGLTGQQRVCTICYLHAYDKIHA